MAPIILSIEGNIGSGKSTFVKYLKNSSIWDNVGKVCFLDEPVDEWNEITDENGITIIERYYADQSAHAFVFQMMAYISRLNRIKEALNGDYDVIIMERSLQTDAKVFAQMLKDENKITTIEFAVYKKWFNSFQKDIPPCNIVYLRTDPATALYRVQKRARRGEDIPLAYLEKCHQYHESWLTESDIDDIWVIINANDNIINDGYHSWQYSVISRIKDIQNANSS